MTRTARSVVTFGRTDHFNGDMEVEICVDETPAGIMRKNYDGPEWYCRAEESDVLRRAGLDDTDLGNRLATAKAEIRSEVARIKATK